MIIHFCNLIMNIPNYFLIHTMFGIFELQFVHVEN
jgi:hypothetical protein